MAKLRKVFTISVMAITVLSMSVVVAPNVQAAASAGDLIKTDAYSTVYYLGDDGKRYGFPNEATFFSWYDDFSGVMTVPQEELESYRVAGMITMRPGTKLVKIQSDPRVYAVEPGGALRWIDSEDTALALYGEDWNQIIVDVPDAFIGNYTVNGNAYGNSSDSDIEATALAGDAYPAGAVVQWEGSEDVYYINADGEAQKFADEAALSANRYGAGDIIMATSVAMPDMGDDIASADSALIDPVSGSSSTGVQPDAGTGLTVALASDTPVSATLPYLASSVEFTKINLTASNDGDVTVRNLVVKRVGVGAYDGVSGVFIYEGNTRLTNSRTVSATTHKATFNGLDLEIPAGTTRTISVRATAAGTTGNHGFEIEAATDITTDGATVTGSFPVVGNLMSLTSTTAGSITVAYQAVSNTTLKVGEIQKEVGKFKITASSVEDINMIGVALTNEGGADPNDLKNFNLYAGSDLVASTATTDADRVELAFDTPKTVKKGGSQIFTLKADIMGGVGASAIQYDFDETSDVAGKGAVYGYNAYVSAPTGTASSITVEAGELTIEIDGPAAYKVASDVDNATLAELTITTGGEEEVEIKALYAYIDATASSSATASPLDDAVENVQLVNTDTGDIYDATADDATDNDDYYFKITNFTAPAGVSHWKVEFDLLNTITGNGDVYKFAIYAGADTTLATEPTSGKKGVQAENADGKALDDIKPGATIEGNNVTVEDASLTVASKNLSAGNAVLKESSVELLRMTMEAGAADDIKVTELAFEDSTTGGGTANNLAEGSDYTLWLVDDSGNLDTKLEEGVSDASGATVTFSELEYNGNSGFTIDANDTVTVAVTTDINSATTTAGNIIQIKASADGITAEDSDGDSIADASVSGNDTAFDGRAVTIQMSGTLVFKEDSEAPSKPHILLSSSAGNAIYSFKADSSYEDVYLKTLKLTNTADSATNTSDEAIAALELWFDADGDGTGAVKIAKKTTINTTTHKIEFTDLDSGSNPVIIDKDKDAIFELRLDVAGIGSDPTDTASSSENITLTLNAISGDVEARGASSNADLAASSISTSSAISSQTDYVYSSKLVASKSSGQPTTLSSGEEEALKFTLTPSGNESDTVQLTDLTVNFAESGSVDVYGFKLYNGAGTEIASSSAGSVGTSDTSEVLTVTDDNIGGSGETYTIKVFSSGANADDKLTVSLDVNGNTGSGDDITWNDGADNAGNITWIDLGESSTITKIENQLLY